MTPIVLTFGLIYGAVMAAMFVITYQFHDEIGFDKGMVIGYTTMVVAGLLIYFGVRAYRDNIGKGVLSFGRGFTVGALIAVVAGVVYVATWETIYFGGFADGYFEKYTAHTMAKARADGETQAQLDERAATLAKYARLYRNPVFNSAMTFMEPLPVGLLLALISAGLLRRRDSGGTVVERVPQAST